jgi:hypothetical protein
MAYEKTNWQNSPSTSTPINATNLNHIEQGIYDTNNAIDKTEVKPSSGTNYYAIFAANTTGVEKQRTSAGVRYRLYNGTTSSDGHSTVMLGNDTESGTADNLYGRIWLYSKGTGGKILTGGETDDTTTSSTYTQRLPNVTGTVVVRQGASITTETNGWYKVDMGAYTMYFINSQTASTTFAANATATIGRNLPSGVSFNAAKMVFVGSARGSDNVIRATTAIADGNTSFTISWHNDYSGSVTTTIIYNATLIVFP